ncbi:hypothetical protein BVC80_1413g29 [Macleaya cordata]|uniref:Uncharacterized protein n=1 Tax=Macleaya cordata TaxID=56857 RepID=A0A200R7T6_MACCD|nr:hypothetical protein BVC80_1413g29 [Macleaya cordata]
MFWVLNEGTRNVYGDLLMLQRASQSISPQINRLWAGVLKIEPFSGVPFNDIPIREKVCIDVTMPLKRGTHARKINGYIQRACLDFLASVTTTVNASEAIFTSSDSSIHESDEDFVIRYRPRRRIASSDIDEGDTSAMGDRSPPQSARTLLMITSDLGSIHGKRTSYSTPSSSIQVGLGQNFRASACGSMTGPSWTRVNPEQVLAPLFAPIDEVAAGLVSSLVPHSHPTESLLNLSNAPDDISLILNTNQNYVAPHQLIRVNGIKHHTLLINEGILMNPIMESQGGFEQALFKIFVKDPVVLPPTTDCILSLSLSSPPVEVLPLGIVMDIAPVTVSSPLPLAEELQYMGSTVIPIIGTSLIIPAPTEEQVQPFILSFNLIYFVILFVLLDSVAGFTFLFGLYEAIKLELSRI